MINNATLLNLQSSTLTIPQVQCKAMRSNMIQLCKQPFRVNLIFWTPKNTPNSTPIHRVKCWRSHHGEVKIQVWFFIDSWNHPWDQVRSIVTPFVTVKSQSKFLNELEQQWMILVEHQHGIVQSAPITSLEVNRLSPDHIFQLRKTPQNYNISVQVNPTKLVQQSKPKQIGEVLTNWDSTRSHIPILEPKEPNLSRSVVEQVIEIRRNCHYSKSRIRKWLQNLKSLVGIQGIWDYDQTSIWVGFEHTLHS